MKILNSTFKTLSTACYRIGMIVLYPFIKICQPLKRKFRPVRRRLRHKKRRLLIISLIAISVLVPLIYFVAKPKAVAAWWDEMWLYRKKIPISAGSSTEDVSDYQVYLILATDSLITAGKMQDDCGDIRFTSAAGVALPYWIEESGDNACNDSDTGIWVKVDNIPKSGTDIYVYYGNPSADDGQRPDETFLFFDDFSSGTFANWVGDTGSYSISNGILSSSATNVSIHSRIGLTDVRIHTRFRGTNASTAKGSILMRDDTQGGAPHGGGRNAYIHNIRVTSEQDHRLIEVNSGTPTTHQTELVPLIVNTWYTSTSYASRDKIGGSVPYPDPVAVTDSTHTYGYVGLGQPANAGFEWDWIMVGKYVFGGPGAGSPGSEEKGPGPIAYWSFDEGYGTTIHNQMEKNGEDGLVGWWKMDEGADNTCPNGTDDVCDTMVINDAVRSGATWTTSGKIGNTLDFDSTDDYVNAGSDGSIDNLTTFTIMAWIYPHTEGEDTGGMIVGQSTGGLSKKFLRIKSSEVNALNGFVDTDSTDPRSISTDNTLTLNQWQHVAMTYDNSGDRIVRLYHNGSEVSYASQFTGTGTITDLSATNLVIGNDETDLANTFDGLIDQTKIFNRALSVSEIEAEYNSEHGHMIDMDASTDWVEGAQQNPNQTPMGKALDFDGTNDKAVLPETIDLAENSPWSISYWFWQNAGTNDDITLGDGTDDYNLFEHDTNGTRLQIIPNGATSIDLTFPYDTRGSWHHAMVTCDGSATATFKLYLDGEEVDSDTNATSQFKLNTFGQGETAVGTYFWTGKLDEAKVYDYDLTADQVKEQYNRGSGAVLGAGEKSSWWDEGWHYRKSITISSGGSAASDYQVRIDDYNTSTDISAGKMQEDCGDIRFTSSTAVELPYWIESGCNTSTTDIWVKVDLIPASGSTTIYMYYGNSSVNNGENGDHTFEFFDDFNDNTIGPMWTEVDAPAEIAETGGKLVFTGGTSGSWDQSVYMTNDLPRGEYAIEFNYKWTSNNSSWDAFMFGWKDDGAGASYTNLVYGYYNPSADTCTTCAKDVLEDGTGRAGVTGNWVRNTQYKVQVHMRNSGGAYYRQSENGGSTWSTSYTSTYSAESNLHPAWMLFAGTHEVDNFFVRKAATTEPSAGSPGTEEKGPAPMGHWSFDEGHGTTVHNQMEVNGEFGLEGWWKLDDASSGTSPAPQDEMGLNNGSFVDNASYTSTAKIGNAATFDGTGDYISMGDVLDMGTDNITLSFWVKTSSSTLSSLVTKAYANPFYHTWMDANGKANITLHNGSTATDSISTTSINDGNWHHVAAVWDRRGKQYVYIDGKEEDSDNISADALVDISNTNPLTFGANCNSTPTCGNHLSGQIDHVKIFKRPLSANEVEAEYDSIHGHMMYMDASSDWGDGARQNPNQTPMGKALDFDGSNDYVTVGDKDELDGLSTITVSTWVNFSSLGTRQSLISKAYDFCSQVNYSVSSYSLAFNSDNNKIYWDVFTCNTAGCREALLTNKTDWQIGRWYHVVGTWEEGSPGVQKIYVDGVLDNSSAPSGIGMNATTTPLVFGMNAKELTFHLNGKLDEAKIYNYVLTADEVKVQYNRGKAMVLGAGINDSDPGTDNLVGHWKLDEGAGFTAFDNSGNGNDGELTNMVYALDRSDWVPGKIGKALDFDGSNDYVNFGSDSSLRFTTQPFTLEAWIYPTATSAEEIIASDDTTNGYGFVIASGKLRLVTRGTTDTYTDSSSTIYTNQWTHVVAVFTGTGGERRLYINGVEDATESFTGSVTIADDPVYIGARPNGSNYFNGQIDNVKIFNTDLTASQIAWEYSQGKPMAHWSFDETGGYIAGNTANRTLSTDGLVAFWRMESATSNPDYSGNGWTGTVTGSPSTCTGKKENCVDFETGAQYMSVASPYIDLDQQYTLMAWFEWPLDTTPTTWNTLFRGTNDHQIMVRRSDNHLGLYDNVGGGGFLDTGFDMDNLSNGWHHIANSAGNFSTRSTFYIDGEVVGNRPVKSTSDIRWIGNYSSGQNWGEVDHVKIYDRWLSGDEIKAEIASNENYGYLTSMDPANDWVDGKRNGALDFDGSNDRVDVPTASFGNEAALSVWAKLDSSMTNCSVSGTYPTILADASSMQNGFFISGLNCNSITFKGDDSASANAVIATVTEDLHQWHHYVGVSSGGNGYLYLDGKLIGSNTSTFTPTFVASGIHIGHAKGYGGRYFKGRIDETKIYNYGLTADQIKVDYNNGAVTFR